MTQKLNNLSWINGLREVFVKDPTGNRVGYFDDVTKALTAVDGDGEYRAVWFSLNICPGVPAGFEPNRLYKASGRFKKTDYAGRQLLLIDCDPKRKADTASTAVQKASAKLQTLAIREYLRSLEFPEPVLGVEGRRCAGVVLGDLAAAGMPLLVQELQPLPACLQSWIGFPRRLIDEVTLSFVVESGHVAANLLDVSLQFVDVC